MTGAADAAGAALTVPAGHITEWLPVDEAAEFLRQRGVTVSYGNQERPLSRKTILPGARTAP